MSQKVDIAKSNQILFVSMWVLFVLGIYLRFAPVVGGVVLPSAIVLALFPLLIVCAYSGPWKVERRDVNFIMLVGAGVFVMMLLSPGRQFLMQKLFAYTQFMVALMCLVTFVSFSRKIPASVRDRLLFWVWVILLAGCFFEVIGVIKGLSDSFRDALYSTTNQQHYRNDLRDIGLVGFPRPKFFTSEPSYVSQMFIICINAWYIMKPTTRRFVVVIAATLVMYAFMSSPKLFVSLGLTFFIFGSQIKRSDLTVKNVVSGSAFLGLIFLILVPQMYDVFYKSIILTLTDINLERMSSANVRIIFPMVTAYDVLSHYPWFGVGIGGKEVVEQVQTLPVSLARAIGTNGFARSLMFFGIGGTIFVFSCFILYLRRTDIVSKWSACAAFGAVFVMDGTIETIYSWGFVAIFMSAILPRARNDHETV